MKVPQTDPDLFTFAQMAFNQFKRYCNLLHDKEEQEAEWERLKTQLTTTDEKPELQLGWRTFTISYELEAELLECKVLAILTTAFFLEAFITNYCTRYESVKFTERHIERLDPVGKWLVIPRLISPPGIDASDEVFGRLRHLFRLRNELAHFKGTKKSLWDFEPKNCMRLIMDLLAKIDELNSEERFADDVCRQIKSWARAASKDNRFYPIVWEA